jgi:hypothetical protein
MCTLMQDIQVAPSQAGHCKRPNITDSWPSTTCDRKHTTLWGYKPSRQVLCSCRCLRHGSVLW